jgi:exodeoxyribonuclease VII large subunit
MSEQTRVLGTLSYKNVLKRGFAVVRDAENRPVPLAARLSPGAPVSIEFADGTVGAITAGAAKQPRQAPRQQAEEKKEAVKPQQGSLF